MNNVSRTGQLRAKTENFPPLDFRAAEFIYLSLLILNQRDWWQLWRVPAAAITPTLMCA